MKSHRRDRLFFHVGFITTDLDEAMLELESLLAVGWETPRDVEVGQWSLRVVRSTGKSPCVELLEGSPGSPWESRQLLEFHHLGRWSDALDDDRERLARSGVIVEVDGRDFGRSFAYMSAPSTRLMIELVSRSEAAAGIWADAS